MSGEIAMTMVKEPIRQQPEPIARKRPWVLIGLSFLGGLSLAVIWSPRLVDRVIAGGIADPIFGGNIGDVDITGSGMAIAFAFVTGVAGMFTACNVAVFSALAPITAHQHTVRKELAALIRPVGLLVLGAVIVSGLYGVLGVIFSESIPQLSNARIGDPETGLRVRSIQSGVVFSLIGIVMLWRGLAYVRAVRNPLAGVFRRYRWAEMLFLGGLIGAFLIGRPFGPFRNLFGYDASTGNPLLGFTTFALQSVGNILGVAVLLVLITLLTRGRFQRWLLGTPGRADRFSAVAFIVAGTFFVFYWGVKLASRAGVLWWPTMPYS
jgi:hypothetical protein